MGLFIISFLLVFASSYLLTSIISPKKSVLGLFYLPIAAFAQLVLTFEVLSLFTAIKQNWVLAVNILFLIIAGVIWYKKGKPLWTLETGRFLNKVKNSFKLDKSLLVLFIGYCVFIFSALFVLSIVGITSADAEAYHVLRSLFWVMNGNLNHFEIPDIRNLCLPINSEILYAWLFLFVRKNVFYGLFSFFGYLMSVVSVYGIMGYLGYCVRKRLWVIFLLSSLPSVIVQASGTETDIIIAGLVSASIFLFWTALRDDKGNKIIPIFMASLAYALATGTKTPSIIAIPAVGLLFLALSTHYKRKEFYKPLGLFIGFGTVNFLIFASFNYILNFVHFSNFMGSESFMVVSRNYYGVKAVPASFVKYMFMFFDFTGFKWSDYVGPHIMHVRDAIINFMHLGYVKDGLYSHKLGLNRSLLEPIMGAGILGFLVYLPCLAWSLIKPVFCRKSEKTMFLFAFGGIFILNLLVISYVLAYMIFSIRFVMFFIVLSSPIFVYSYFSKKNPLKYVIIAFSLFYLTCVSTHLWARPFFKIISLFAEHHSITEIREVGSCKNFIIGGTYSNSGCILAKQISKRASKKDKIILFPNTSENLDFVVGLMFDGYNIDIRNLEDAKKIDFNKYNVVITTNKGQISTVVKDYEKRKGECTIDGSAIVTKKGNIVPCLYQLNGNSPTKTKPFQVECLITKEFLQKYHLKPIAVAGVIAPKDTNPSFYILFRH